MVSKILLTFIKIYRRFISPAMPPVCRFSPTCSDYAEEAIKKYGTKGIFFVIKRILKCHPFHPGGYDPLR
ncbi:MAG: membrane protein insertion efficiency factor YidD [Thermodesulfovibrio sp.]|nr:membrane protein insertion efficiency factor YidD [Thermodesulfovibrio sp.]